MQGPEGRVPVPWSRTNPTAPSGFSDWIFYIILFVKSPKLHFPSLVTNHLGSLALGFLAP